MWCAGAAFSVGFGNPIWSRYDRHGTEFAIAAIPLGGYVKMLDEREGPVPDDQRHEAFTSKPPGQRIAIAAAGPAANFIFAIAAYWLLSVVGFTTVAPVTGEIAEGSIADRMGLRSGMEIHQVDGRNVTSWRDINMRLLERAGEQDEVSFTISDGQGERTLTTTLNGWQLPDDNPDPLGQFGLSPLRPDVPAQIGQVVSGGRRGSGTTGRRPGARSQWRAGSRLVCTGGSDPAVTRTIPGAAGPAW